MMTSKSFVFEKKFFQYLTVFIVFCFLALTQTAFFGHLSIYGARLNLIFIAVFLLGFFTEVGDRGEEKTNGLAVTAGAVGGFLLDIFSPLPFGCFTFTFLLLAFLIKKSHVFFHKSNKAAFLVAFLLSFLFYKICFAVVSGLLVLIFERHLSFAWPINATALIELLYNFIVAGLVFLFFALRKDL